MLFDFITIAITNEVDAEVTGEPPMEGLSSKTKYVMLWTSEEILSLLMAKVTG